MDGAGPTTILKRDALGRVTVTREQREALLDEFERGGLSGTRFARMVGVNYSTFAYWAQQRRHARGVYAPLGRKAASAPPAGALRLMEAVPVALMSARASGGALEVLLPGGARVLVADAHQVALTAQLINALRSSSC